MLPDVGAARAEKRDSSLFPVTFRCLCIPGDFPVGDFLGNFPGDFPGDFPVQYMKSKLTRHTHYCSGILKGHGQSHSIYLIRLIYKSI